MKQVAKMTVDEYLAEYADREDSWKYELLDGEVVVSPEPTPYHGRLQVDLAGLLKMYARRNRRVVVYGPTNVALSEVDCLGPDLTVTVEGDGTRLRGITIQGSPAVLVEFVSPSKPNYDLVDKRQTYTARRVPEIWFFHTVTREAILLTLTNGAYVAQRMSTGVFQSTVLPGFRLDIGALFDLDFDRLLIAAGL